MKIKAMIASAVIIASLSATSAFAIPVTACAETVKYDIAESKRIRHKNCGECMEDPIARLENKKSEVLKMLDEGKITKENADAVIKKIDSRIAEIKDFNKLTLDQKREKLIEDCKSRLDLLVKDGKIDKKKADDIQKSYTDKIKQWDGVGYPKFFGEGMKGKKH